jgi:hypothetical protein
MEQGLGNEQSMYVQTHDSTKVQFFNNYLMILWTWAPYSIDFCSIGQGVSAGVKERGKEGA